MLIGRICFMSNRIQIGQKAEDLVYKYLLSKGYTVVKRNYNKKFAEIDIIARKLKVTHFIEVKSVSRENTIADVIHETDVLRPEERVDRKKMRKIMGAATIFMDEFGLSKGRFQFDVYSVEFFRDKTRVRAIKDIIF